MKEDNLKKYLVRIMQVLLPNVSGEYPILYARDCTLISYKNLYEFVKELNTNGFQDGNIWIMPSSILWVKEIDL